MNIPALIDRHLTPWYVTPPSHIPGVTPTLREVCEAMINEALAEDDTVWIPLERHNEAMAEMQRKLDAMTQARNDAVGAAHEFVRDCSPSAAPET